MIKLLITDEYGEVQKELTIDASHKGLAAVNGTYMEVDGVEYYIAAVKSIVEDKRVTTLLVKLCPDNAKFR